MMTVSLTCWWNQFWEMRYKELQAKGEDTDNHDFKSEWIPHWSRRSTEIYEDEVKQKTQELLMKFELFQQQPAAVDYEPRLARVHRSDKHPAQIW